MGTKDAVRWAFYGAILGACFGVLALLERPLLEKGSEPPPLGGGRRGRVETEASPGRDVRVASSTGAYAAGFSSDDEIDRRLTALDARIATLQRFLQRILSRPGHDGLPDSAPHHHFLRIALMHWRAGREAEAEQTLKDLSHEEKDLAYWNRVVDLVGGDPDPPPQDNEEKKPSSAQAPTATQVEEAYKRAKKIHDPGARAEALLRVAQAASKAADSVEVTEVLQEAKEAAVAAELMRNRAQARKEAEEKEHAQDRRAAQAKEKEADKTWHETQKMREQLENARLAADLAAENMRLAKLTSFWANFWDKVVGVGAIIGAVIGLIARGFLNKVGEKLEARTSGGTVASPNPSAAPQAPVSSMPANPAATPVAQTQGVPAHATNGA